MHTSQDTIDNRRNDASSHFPSPMRLGRAQLHAALGALVLLGTLFAATAGCDKKGLPAAPPDGAEDSSPCVLFVTTPSGGDTLVVGQQYSLEWAVSDCGDRVKIELWQAGEPVAAIANFSKNDGDYTWTAAQVDSATDDYQVRVEDLTSGSDAFSEAFTIAVPPVNEEDPPACTIAVTAIVARTTSIAGRPSLSRAAVKLPMKFPMPAAAPMTPRMASCSQPPSPCCLATNAGYRNRKPTIALMVQLPHSDVMMLRPIGCRSSSGSVTGCG